MEQIPILMGGKTVGSVTLRRQGAYMLCSGRADWCGDMVRLWLYGKGAPGYLGVLMPEAGGKATVQKKFSMADFAKLPCPVKYCAPEGWERAAPPPDNGDVYWFAMADGTLTRMENGRRLMAFPADEVRLPRGGRFLLRVIDGKQYVIFPG